MSIRWNAVGSALLVFATSPARTKAPAGADYQWSRETDSAAWEGSYNFPVFVVRNEMWALHPRGAWSSRDGRHWVRSDLPASGLNSGYQRYLQFHDAVYALGTMTGNYLDLHLTSRIARTRDFKSWEVLANESNLPPRVFYGAVVFQDKMWLLGGFDGHTYYNDVWNSADGVHWTRVAEHAGWSARDADMVPVFKNRIWVIGGGVIDGQREPNPNSTREVWSSADGVHWDKSPDRAGAAWGGAPVVFDDQLWLIAANRNSTFAPALLVTADGQTWQESTAPWSPRGAPAVWVFDQKLFMAGGKYSVTENGTQRFIYRNDVWSMSSRPNLSSIHYAAPRDFHGLPAKVIGILEARGCRIPQDYSTRALSNVVRGSFTAARRSEWALLCSVRDTNQILIVAATGNVVDSLERHSDFNDLEGIGSGQWGFSRVITVLPPKTVRGWKHDDYDGQRIPRPIDHDAVNDGIEEKAAVGYYHAGGRWYRQITSD